MVHWLSNAGVGPHDQQDITPSSAFQKHLSHLMRRDNNKKWTGWQETIPIPKPFWLQIYLNSFFAGTPFVKIKE